ncbi:MAG: hypothetical protein ACHQRJ_14115, partial [Alphaproteobacteria bacterium]
DHDKANETEDRRSASKADLAFSPASIFRLVRFVMIRSIYHDGTAHAPINPLVPNPGSTSLMA